MIGVRIVRQVTIDDRAAAVLSAISAYNLAPLLAEHCGQSADDIRHALNSLAVETAAILRAKKAAESAAHAALRSA